MSIIVENLSYVYMKGSPFEKIALKDVNLQINSGEFVGVIGHTGSGKSTLIQHFNGILRPSSGRVLINGLDTNGQNLKELRKHVGIVFQYPEHQLFEETVYKDIAFGLVKQGIARDIIDTRIENAIRDIGIKKEILEKSPFELSGGQKRRVAIAGVLAMEPDILVLDEPTAGLDPRGRDEVFELILGLHKDRKITVVFVSHSMEDVAKLAQRVIVMNEGGVEIDGKPCQVFSQAHRLEEIGLSAPQIAHLMKKLKTIIPDMNENIFTIEDAKNELSKYIKRF